MPRYHSPSDYVAAARAQETSAEELRRLAHSQYSFVRTEVARNPNTESDVIVGLVPDMLKSDAEYALALAIIGNINTPDIAIKEITRHIIAVPHFEPRHFYQKWLLETFCSLPHINIEHIKEVLSQANIPKSLRKRVARGTIRTDVLQILVKDQSENVHREALKRLKEIENRE